MTWIWILAACLISVVIEGVFILQDKMPWRKGKGKKHGKR